MKMTLWEPSAAHVEPRYILSWLSLVFVSQSHAGSWSVVVSPARFLGRLGKASLRTLSIAGRRRLKVSWLLINLLRILRRKKVIKYLLQHSANPSLELPDSFKCKTICSTGTCALLNYGSQKGEPYSLNRSFCSDSEYTVSHASLEQNYQVWSL